MSSLKWGAFAPQGWKLEFTGMSGREAFERSVEIATQAEDLGYDHLWVYDHVETVPTREAEPMFEAWTLLAALSQHTSRAGLGQLVTCAAYRNAGLLAKEAAGLDCMSDGRLIFGIGAGWYHEEYAAYGWEFPSARTRLRIMDETIQAVRRLWTEDRATFEGEHVRFRDATCHPKPVQASPPIWVGGGGEKVTLKIAAIHADATNWQVGLDAFVHKSEVLRRHCADVGRDFDEIVRTHGPDCILFDSDAEMDAWVDGPHGGHLRNKVAADEWKRDNFVGTVDQVMDKVQGFVDAGCREFVLWFRDYPATTSLERFMAEVVPEIRAP